MACCLRAGFVPVRKEGKLPAEAYSESYQLEYGSATVEVHTDAFEPGERVLIVDDVLATGGTAAAAASLVRRSGAEVAGDRGPAGARLSRRPRQPARPARSASLLTV